MKTLYVVMCEWGGWGGTETSLNASAAFVSRERAENYVKDKTDAQAAKPWHERDLADYEIYEVELVDDVQETA